MNKTHRRDTPNSSDRVVELPAVKGRSSENDHRSIPGSANGGRYSLLKPPMGMLDKKRKESADSRSRVKDASLAQEQSLSFKIGVAAAAA